MVFHVSYSDCGSCDVTQLEDNKYQLCNGWVDVCRIGYLNHDLVLDINSVIDTFDNNNMSIGMKWGKSDNSGVKARIELYLI